MAYLNGLWVEKPHPNAPSFVKAKISINVGKMLDSLKNTNEAYINLQLKESKEGHYYAEIDEWKPDNSNKPEPLPEDVIEPEDEDDQLPF